MNHTGRLGFTAAALALALTLGACASHRSPLTGVQLGAAGGQAAGSGATQPAAQESMFGTLPSPCGPGDAKGATDQGVTDEAISIGFGDDRGYSAGPGLNQEMGDAVEAMIAWCNEQGGINGRKIVGDRYDAAYVQAPQVMQKACEKDFMLVGQGFVGDESAEAIRVGCNLPSVPGFTVGPNAAMGPMKFEPVPYPVDKFNAAPLEVQAKLFPQFASNMTTLNSTSPGIQVANSKIVGVLKSMGITPKDCGVTLNQQGEPNYVSFAEKFKDCGIEALWNSGSPTPIAFNMLEAMKRVGLDTTLVFEATWYSPAVAAWTKKSGWTINLGLVFQPLENAAHVPATQKYLDIVKAHGGKEGLIGVQSTSAFLLWATAAKECGAELTRQCMVDKLSGIHEWTAGGLHAPSDPGANLPSDCTLILSVTNGSYTQIEPKKAGEFTCNPDYVRDTDPKTLGVTLNDDRVSTKFLTGKELTPTS